MKTKEKTMKRAVKLVSLLLAVLLLAAVAIGCKKEKDSDTGKYDTQKGATAETQKGSPAYQKWMDLLKDYDKWTDKYVKVLDKYSKNPNDASALSDYMDCLTELTQWEAKLADIGDDDELTNQEAVKVMAEYERITLKWTKAAAKVGR